jgi:hypothetical protein
MPSRCGGYCHSEIAIYSLNSLNPHTLPSSGTIVVLSSRGLRKLFPIQEMRAARFQEPSLAFSNQRPSFLQSLLEIFRRRVLVNSWAVVNGSRLLFILLLYSLAALYISPPITRDLTGFFRVFPHSSSFFLLQNEVVVVVPNLGVMMRFLLLVIGDRPVKRFYHRIVEVIGVGKGSHEDGPVSSRK